MEKSLLPSKQSLAAGGKIVTEQNVAKFLTTAEAYRIKVAPLLRGLQNFKKFERIIQLCFQRFLLLKCLIDFSQHECPTMVELLTENLGDINEYIICEVTIVCHSWEAKDIVNLLTNQINDADTSLRRGLFRRYSLEKVVAQLSSTAKDNIFELWTYTTISGSKQKIKTDVQSKEMERFIMSFSHQVPAKTSWNCKIALLDVELGHESNFDSGFVDFQKDKSTNHDQHSLMLDIFTVIKTKENLAYNLWTLLLKYKSSALPVNDLISEEGLNILQLCLDKGKLTLLQSIFNTGWWHFLSQQRVPEWGPPEYRGKMAKALAEAKRVRKPLDEYNRFSLLDDSLSSLMKAIRCNDNSKARSLMRTAGEELYLVDNNNGNALYWAVVAGSLDIFTELMNLGVDYGMVTSKKENLLHVACLFGRSRFVPILLKDCKADVWMEDTGHKTPVDRAAENGDLTTLQAFIDCGVLPRPVSVILSALSGRLTFVMYCVDTLHMDINAKDLYGRTAVQRACEGKQALIVNYLLGKGADLTISTCTNKNIFHFLAEAGDTELTKLILQKMSNSNILLLINQRERYSGEPLCFLIRGRDKGREAWHYVEVERIKVPIFLKKTKSGNVDVATFGTVLKSGWGANPSPDDIEEIESLFKSRKFDTTLDPDVTPLHLALFKDHNEIALLLLDNGAEVNTKDKCGNTPLMIAASRGNKDMILELDRRGAHLDQQNSQGMSAIDIADENQQDDVIHLMKGKETASVSESFLEETVHSVENALSDERLNQLRQSGQDVRRHIIDTREAFDSVIS